MPVHWIVRSRWRDFVQQEQPAQTAQPAVWQRTAVNARACAGDLDLPAVEILPAGRSEAAQRPVHSRTMPDLSFLKRLAVRHEMRSRGSHRAQNMTSFLGRMRQRSAHRKALLEQLLRGSYDLRPF